MRAVHIFANCSDVLLQWNNQRRIMLSSKDHGNYWLAAISLVTHLHARRIYLSLTHFIFSIPASNTELFIPFPALYNVPDAKDALSYVCERTITAERKVKWKRKNSNNEKFGVTRWRRRKLKWPPAAAAAHRQESPQRVSLGHWNFTTSRGEFACSRILRSHRRRYFAAQANPLSTGYPISSAFLTRSGALPISIALSRSRGYT